jgi:prepilin-type N-terminal cleavage/methylation domain-containing protein
MVRRRRDRGFTIIELLVSMALASIGLMGLLALQVSAIRGNALSRNFLEASGIAQQIMEQAAETPYASLSTLVAGSCIASNNPTVPPSGTLVNFTSITGETTTAYTYCTIVTAGTTSTFVQTLVRWTESTNTSSVTHNIWMTTVRAP